MEIEMFSVLPVKEQEGLPVNVVVEREKKPAQLAGERVKTFALPVKATNS